MKISVITDPESWSGDGNPVSVIEKEAAELRHTIGCALDAVNAVSTSFSECANARDNMAQKLEIYPGRDDELGSFYFLVQVSLLEAGWSYLFNVVAKRLVSGVWSVIVVSKEHKMTRREREGVEEADLSQTIVTFLQEVNQDSSVLTRNEPT